MSKKYIITIKSEYEDTTRDIMVLGARDNNPFVDTVTLDDLEELNSDYINEHFGDLQDTAYQRGLDDAWEAARKIIRMSDGDILDLFPDCYASVCTAVQAILKYDASEVIEKLKAYEKKADDEIKVGDEVNWIGDCFIVTRIFQPRNMKEQCDGIDDDGCVYHDVVMDDLEKTGRHFDIDKILEEMRHD